MGAVTGGILFLICGSAASALAVDHIMMLDRSGSMKFYYQTRTMQRLCNNIEGVAAPHGRVLRSGFATTTGSFDSCDTVQALPGRGEGANTYLDLAIDAALATSAEIMWIVTDNVQDEAGSSAAGNTEVFYDRLRSPVIERIGVVPLLQPPGNRGLVVYVLLRAGSAAGAAYDSELAEFLNWERTVSATELLPMKPLDREPIVVEPVETSPVPVFQEGDKVVRDVRVRYRSRFPHLRVHEAPFHTEVHAPEFGPDSLLTPETMAVNVNPERLTDLEPGTATRQEYVIRVDMGTVGLKHDLHSLWRAAFAEIEETVDVPVSYGLTIPRRSFELRPDLLDRFHADAPESADASGRIYDLRSLPERMATENTTLRFTEVLRIRVVYPSYPAVILIGVLVAALAALAALAWAARRMLRRPPLRWVINAETEKGSALRCNLDADGGVRVDGKLLGRLVDDQLVLDDGAYDDEGGSRIRLDRRREKRVRVRDGAKWTVLILRPEMRGGTRDEIAQF